MKKKSRRRNQFDFFSIKKRFEINEKITIWECPMPILRAKV